MFLSAKRLIALLTYGVYAAPVVLLLYYKRTMYPFLTLKILTFEILILALFLIWTLLVLRYPEYRPRLTKIHLATIVFLGLYTMSSALGVDIHRSLWSSQARGIGLIALYAFYGLYLVLTTIKVHIDFTRFIKWNVVIGGVVGLSAIIQRFAPELFFVANGARPGGVLGNPAYLSSYLVIILFFALYFLIKAFQDRSLGGGEYKKLVFYGVINLIIVSALLFANTRGALLALAVVFFGALVSLSVKKFNAVSIKRNYPLLSLIAALLIVVAITLTPSAKVWSFIPGLNRFELAADDASIDNRLSTWNIALDAAKEKPLIGWGLENFKYGFDRNYNPELFRSGFGDTYFDKPHNVPLEMLTTGGVLGFLAYLAVIILAYRAVRRRENSLERNLLTMALGAYLIQSLFFFDTFGSCLIICITLAYLDGEQVLFKAHQLILRVAGYIWFAVVCAALIYGSERAVQMWRGNRAQYETLNYFAQYVHARITAPNQKEQVFEELLDRAYDSYEAGEAIKQPYYTDFVHNFMTGISDTIQQSVLPDAGRFIGRALNDYNLAIQFEPLDYFNHVARADARTIFARINPLYLAGAEKDLEEAERLSPNRQQTRFVAAKIRLQLHDTAGAFSEIQKAIDLDPLAGEPHFYLGLIALQVGDTKRGFSEIEKAEELGRSPRSAQEFRMLGGAYGDSGNYERAFTYFSGAVAAVPDDLESRMKLGITAYYIGKNDIAKEQFEYVLPRVPEFKNTPNYQELLPVFDQLGIK